MTLKEATGEREFRVAFAGSLPGAPFEGPGELVIDTRPPDDRPWRITARFHVAGADLRMRLPNVLAGSPFEARGLELARGAAGGKLIVEFQAKPSVFEGLTGGLSTLLSLQGYLLEAPGLLDFAGYALESVTLESA